MCVTTPRLVQGARAYFAAGHQAQKLEAVIHMCRVVEKFIDIIYGQVFMRRYIGIGVLTHTKSVDSFILHVFSIWCILAGQLQ